MKVEACDLAPDTNLLIDRDGRSIDRIVGFEREYGVTLRLDDSEIDGELTDDQLRELTYQTVAVGFWTDKKRYSPFLGNYREDGDREYIDHEHPEVSTVETVGYEPAADRVVRGHLKTAARYGEETVERANDHFLDRLGGRPLRRIDVYSDSTSPSGYTWGSHENFLARRSLELDDFAPAFIAHLVSRIVWSGVGEVVPKGDSGFIFALSEKAEHIYNVIGSDTTSNRAIINTRDEALADPLLWRRIHIASGEGETNPFVTALRAASGAILLTAIEAGVDFSDLVPVNPVGAMREISRDPSLTHRIELQGGRYFTALDLQEALVLRSVVGAKAYFTSQQKHWSSRWHQLIGDLRDDRTICLDRVEWLVKQGQVDKAMTRKRRPGDTDFDVAAATGHNFHRLSDSATGMHLLKSGFYALSPSPEVFTGDLPLPATRGGLRGDAIRRLRAAGRDYSADWVQLKLNDKYDKTIMLKDPFATEDEQLESFLERAAGFIA